MPFPIRMLMLALLAATATALAAEKPAAPAASAAATGGAQFALRDGTVIVGKTDLKAIDVMTAYGTLSVPINDVLKIRIGKKSDHDLKSKIDKCIADLGSKDFAARDQATTELSKLGRLAYTELRKAVMSDDLEVKERAAKLLDDMGAIEDEADVPRQRNTREENVTIKSGGTPAAWGEQPEKQRPKDVDARWTKKNDERHFGCKNHVKADAQGKLIETYAVTDASVHDSQMLAPLVDGAEGAVYADSAYRSASAEAMLAAKQKESKP